MLRPRSANYVMKLRQQGNEFKICQAQIFNCLLIIMNPINLKIILKFQLKHFAEIIFLFVSVVNFLSLRQKTFQPTDL